MDNILKNKRGQLGGGLVGAVLGIMLLIIIVEAVVIPTNNSVLDTTTTINGTARTVLGYNQLLLATLIIVAIVGTMGVVIGGRR